MRPREIIEIISAPMEMVGRTLVTVLTLYSINTIITADEVNPSPVWGITTAILLIWTMLPAIRKLAQAEEDEEDENDK